MPRIFISYSRVDRSLVDDLVPLLREVYGLENVWFDENLHGGQVWWEEILRQIAACDIFIISGEMQVYQLDVACALQSVTLPLRFNCSALDRLPHPPL